MADANDVVQGLTSVSAGVGFAAAAIAGIVQAVRKGNRKTRDAIRSQNLKLEDLWAYLYILRSLLAKEGIPIPPPTSTWLRQEFTRAADTDGGTEDKP